MELQADGAGLAAARITGVTRDQFAVEPDADAAVPGFDLHFVPVVGNLRAGPGSIEEVDAAAEVFRGIRTHPDLNLVAEVSRRLVGHPLAAAGETGSRGVANGHAAVSPVASPVFEVKVEFVKVLAGVEPGLMDAARGALAEDRAIAHHVPETVSNDFPSIEISRVGEICPAGGGSGHRSGEQERDCEFHAGDCSNKKGAVSIPRPLRLRKTAEPRRPPPREAPFPS